MVGELFNAGTGVEVSIGQLAEDIVRLMNADVEITEDRQRIRPQKSEVMRLVADASFLGQRTGWRPTHTRDEGLARTVEWFSDPANLAHYKPHQYNR